MHEDDYLTVAAACALIGGNKPISHATFYRGVRAGIYPAPGRISAQLVRVYRADLLAALGELAQGGA
jgi:predicted DNA-binding transcriptional regulator AlpA